MSRVWRAYENDGVELSKPEGCKTYQEAAAICKAEWQLTVDEMGYDPGFDFYIQLEEETDAELRILQEIPLRFAQKKNTRRTHHV